MLWLFSRFILRQLARHPAMAVLNILGVALGVAIFTGMQIANESSLRAFRQTIDVVAGRSQLEITADFGRFDERLFQTVTAGDGIAAATPTVEAICAVMTPASDGDAPESFTARAPIRILGLDIFSNRAFRPLDFGGADASAGQSGFAGSALEKFLTQPRTISLSEKTAHALGVGAGDTLHVLVGQEIVPLVIVTVFSTGPDQPVTDEFLGVMDIAHAQELFSAIGLLNRIDIRADESLSGRKLRDRLDAVREQIAPFLPPGVSIQAPDRRGARTEKMLWAFQLNLTALSLLSLVVGMFLIYNTTTTAVVRRRAELGILRAVGCPASTVRNLILCEAALQGAVGAVAGWFLGITLADGLTGAVSQTIQSLYIASSVASAHVPWTLAPVVFAVTLAAVLLSAWAPAREAAQIAPVESFSEGHLHLKSSVDKMRHFEIGLAICVLSGLCALGAVWFYPPLGFLSALSLTLGVAFFCPLLLDGFCRGLSAFCLNRGQWLPALAARSCSFALNRTSVAVASLMAALSMMVGVSIMIHSFRGTVDSWIAQTVKADIIVSPASQLVSGPGTGLDPAMVEALRKDPAIRLVDTYSEMRLAHEGETIKVAGTALRQIPEQGNLRLLDTSAQKLRTALTAKNARSPAPRKALVSDVFARKFGVNPGDKLTLTFPSGPVTLEIVSRYRDYTTELGVVLMDAALMRELTGSYHPHSLGLYLRDSSQAPAVRDRLLAQFAPRGELLVLANAELKDKILVIFDQTFAVTTILRSMALIIAGLGIFQTLTVLVTEQTRALGILRATGCSAAGIQRLVFWEAGILGTVAAFLGIAAGIVLSLILCYVINLAFFRWTIEWSLPPGLLAGVWPAVLIVACLAAWLPARRAARLQISTCVKNQ